MGHDTRAYLGRSVPADLERVASPEELREEIAYLPGNYGLYEALDAQFYDGKVSGIGIGRWFARAQLQEAARRLRSMQEELEGTLYTIEPAIEFVRTCLDRLPADQDALYIDFG